MKVAIIIVSALCGFLVSSISFAAENTPTGNTEGHTRAVPFVLKPAALTEGTYQQSIDHFGQLSGQTFAQRYWVDTEYASSPTSAPVIYHFCGEGDCTQDYFLNDNAIEWAQTLGANLVYLEHRYYGESLPFSDLANDHMQYLTLDNVIADLAGFQQWLTTSQGWTGKWISVGGSYSGTLSAIYRLKHPELVVGALASSAPMISGQGESENDASGASSTDPSSDTGDRQWVYESCTEFGFWEASGDDPSSTLYEPSSSLCQQLFGNVTLFNSTTYNQTYNAPFITNSATAPTNILFTYGSDDVWTNIGLTQQTNTNPGITLRTIDGAGHHFDLNAPTSDDSADVIAARAAFVTLAQQWLGLSN